MVPHQRNCVWLCVSLVTCRETERAFFVCGYGYSQWMLRNTARKYTRIFGLSTQLIQYIIYSLLILPHLRTKLQNQSETFPHFLLISPCSYSFSNSSSILCFKFNFVCCVRLNGFSFPSLFVVIQKIIPFFFLSLFISKRKIGWIIFITIIIYFDLLIILKKWAENERKENKKNMWILDFVFLKRGK